MNDCRVRYEAEDAAIEASIRMDVLQTRSDVSDEEGDREERARKEQVCACPHESAPCVGEACLRVCVPVLGSGVWVMFGWFSGGFRV